MSYILDALQKSAAESTTEPLNSPPRTAPAGLALPWKIAIGVVLATNMLLLFLWRTDRASDSVEGAQPAPDNGYEVTSGYPATQPASAQPGNVQSATTGNLRGKKTLPGIATPRDPVPSRPATTSAPENGIQAGTARTFKPTGAAITIAEPDRRSSPPDLEQPTVRAPNPVTDQAPRQQSPTVASNSAKRQAGKSASQLSQLSDGARETLYVLTFSTHIYGADTDLRAVVVNGQRLTEGNSVTADNGQEFLLQEITDNGVILQFEHDGETETVQIPVMEDWKDA